MKELLLRIKTVLKRTQTSPESAELSEYTIGNFLINFKSFEVLKDGEVIERLSDKQSKLLKLLIENKIVFC